MGRKTCLAVNCNSSAERRNPGNLSYHRFPISNPKLLKQWLEAGNFKRTPTGNSVLCSKHFTIESYIHCRIPDITKNFLRKDAVPTIFPLVEVEPINSESESVLSESVDYNFSPNETHEVCLSEESSSLVNEDTMDQEEVHHTSFDSLCRICSKKFEKAELIPIFEEENTLEKISSCLPLMIHQGDSLPHNVCESCLQMVESSFELIVKAQCSEQYFFKLIRNLNKVLDEEPTVYSEEDQPKKRKPVTLDLYKKFGCDICGQQLKRAEELDEHIQETHINQSAPPNTTFTVNTICSLCGQLFEGEDNYILHKCENMNKCSSCKKVFNTKCLLNRHVQNLCKQLFYCQHCYRSYTTKSALLKHMQNHPEANVKANCAACAKKSQGAGDLEHTCIEVSSTKFSSSKKYRCYICGQGYKRQMNLVRHCSQHEPKSTWKFECQKCGETFEKERLLHLHYEKIHKMPKTWICRFCGKSLATKLSMQIHERIHTQVKPYVCEWCGNAFRSKANLIQHHAKHTGVKRHKCPVCGKMFSRTFFLKTHLRVHTGERPFQCDVCEQRFTQVGDMRRHKRRHEQPTSGRPAVFIVRRPPAPFLTIDVETNPVKAEEEVQN